MNKRYRVSLLDNLSCISADVDAKDPGEAASIILKLAGVTPEIGQVGSEDEDGEHAVEVNGGRTLKVAEIEDSMVSEETSEETPSGAWAKCDACDTIWITTCLTKIEKPSMRLTPGGITPSGQCPDKDCGGLCFPSHPATNTYDGLGLGYCHDEHGSYKMDSEQTECPTCDDTEQ